MRLVDQRHKAPFYLQMHGAQADTEDLDLLATIPARLASGDRTILADATLFRAPDDLPAEVESLPDWKDEWALLASAKPSPDGALVLANLLPVVRGTVAEMRGRWCLFDLRNGRLRHSFAFEENGERLVDVGWAGSAAVELRWTPRDATDDYVLVLRGGPSFAVIQRATFAFAGDNGGVRLSAEALELLVAPADWLVWGVTGHGESGFEIVEVTPERIARRFSTSIATDGHEPAHAALAPSRRWLAFLTATAEGRQLVAVDLDAGERRAVPLEVEGHPDHWSLQFTSPDALTIDASDREPLTIPIPPPPSAPLVVRRR